MSISWISDSFQAEEEWYYTVFACLTVNLIATQTDVSIHSSAAVSSRYPSNESNVFFLLCNSDILSMHELVDADRICACIVPPEGRFA